MDYACKSCAYAIDGYGADPDQSLEDPLGMGGTALHEWVFATRTFQRTGGASGRKQSAGRGERSLEVSAFAIATARPLPRPLPRKRERGGKPSVLRTFVWAMHRK
jgi:hypothetical protein